MLHKPLCPVYSVSHLALPYLAHDSVIMLLSRSGYIVANLYNYRILVTLGGMLLVYVILCAFGVNNS